MKNYINILETYSQANKYFTLYKKICENSLNREIPIIKEKHHILPKCFKLGGNIDKENIVYLTPKEHFICHKLLVKFITDKILKAKLSYAMWQLSRKYSLSAREYNFLKTELSNNTKNILKSEEHKKKLRKPKSSSKNMGNKKGWKNPFKGINLSKEICLKISNSKKGKNVGCDNHFYHKHHSPETIEILRQKNINKKLSEETKQKISQTLIGHDAWNKGIPCEMDTKKKISNSLSNRKNINNGIINKRVKEKELEIYLTQGWKLGFKTG